ncbi:TonB-dependent receptor [Terriglobus saanensis]|nr:TonB-dependent receptor [Terriglobus saanensis]
MLIRSSSFSRVQLYALCFMAFLLSMPLIAQNIVTAQLSGIVRDQTGAAISNAAVTVTDSSRAISRSTTSDAMGNYLVLQLPPGTYSITAESAGFARFTANHVVLTVGEQAALPLTLFAAGSEAITVNSDANLIETQGSAQSSLIDQLRINNLPTNGRNYINFALVNSQIARDAAPPVGALMTSGLNFGGIRARSNSINVDGADAGDYISGGTRATVSQDAVQEFQIITNGFSAEYGRASGGVVNIVTKSGNNTTHASAFGFLRNRYLQATNPFSTVDQPAFTRVQAGFTVGGAIVRDKTFFFFSTEITRRQETGFSTIGSDNFGLTNIDVSKFYGTPAGSLMVQGTPDQGSFLASAPANTPGIQEYVALVGSSSSLAVTGKNPVFLQPSLGTNNFASSGQVTPASYVALNSLIGNFPVSEKTEIYSLRLDHKLTSNQQLMLRSSFSPSFMSGIQESAANQNLGQNSFSRTAAQRYHDLSIVGQHTLLLGSNKVNELRFQYSRHPVNYSPSNAPGSNNTAVNIPGFAYFGKTPFTVEDRIEDQYQLQDYFTLTRGTHTFKAGIDVRDIPINIKQAELYSGGDYTFAGLDASSLAPAFSGLPSFSPIQAYGLGIPQSFVQGVGLTRYKYDLKTLGAFLQDNWRLTPTITLNYGVRYDIEAFPTPGSLNANTYAAERAFGVRQGIPLRANNYAPRIGAAWNIHGEDKTVLRANYGLFYDRAPGPSEAESTSYNTYTVPLVILAGGSPCTAASIASPLNLNATNTFQGSLTNANCVTGANLNYLPGQQRFNPNSTDSVFNNQNFLSQGFPLAILPSGLPIDLHYQTPYVQQVSLSVERSFGRDTSLTLAYNSTGGRHLNRPVNVNPVNPALLVANWRNAIDAAQAGTASVLPGTPQSAVASATSNPLTVATAAGTLPCGSGPSGPYVTPAALNFFRRSGLNTSLAQFLTSQGAGACIGLANQIATLDGLGVGVPVPFGDINSNLTTGTSAYNALSINLKKRYAENYEFLVSYTWSHAIDDATDLISTSDGPQNNFNPNSERATSSFDQRHRLVLSGVYNVGRGGSNGLMRRVFSNMTVAPIIEIASGKPFNILTGTDTNFDFNPLTDRPNAVPVNSATTSCGSAPVRSKFSPTGAFNIPCYIDAPANAGPGDSNFNGSLGRNAGLKPFNVFTDFRFAKTFTVEHGLTFQATADVFNLINKNNTLDVDSLYSDAGRPTSAYDARQFQFGGRISF